MTDVTGTLGLFSLVDLFQLLAASRRTGRLTVQHPLGPARFYFDKGQLRHAEFWSLEGAAAVDVLFGDERGTFVFVAGLPAPRTTIETSTEAVVLDALRRLDESRREDAAPTADMVVGHEAVPYGVDGDAAAGARLSEPERRLLAAVNGHWTAARIARELELDPDDVAKTIGRLVQVGLLRLRTRRPRTARLVVRLAAPNVPDNGVGVDTGIVRAWREVTGAGLTEVALRLSDQTAVAVPLVMVDGAGPHLQVPRAMLVRLGLQVDDVVLARPYVSDVERA
jgi:hypothetical protein